MMNKWCRCLLCALLAGCIAVPAGAESALPGTLFEGKSDALNMELAWAALALSSVYTEEQARRTMDDYGLTLLAVRHYDKADDDERHTSAFCVGQKEIEAAGKSRTLVVVSVRGTSGGEWGSNFDVAPSHSDQTAFAENFFFAAEDILETLQPILDGLSRPLVLVTGYSRGAACANLLAMLLDILYGNERVYAYTFATPMTVRDDRAGALYQNIFNFINPGDLVTRLPLEAWGFARAGVDVTLPADADDVQAAKDAADAFAALAPSISSYYGDRHSLTASGLSEQGVTAYEFMRMLISAQNGEGEMTGMTGAANGANGADATAFLGMMRQGGSDYAALIGTLGGLSVVGAQHMPDAYRALMQKLAAD